MISLVGGKVGIYYHNDDVSTVFVFFFFYVTPQLLVAIDVIKTHATQIPHRNEMSIMNKCGTITIFFFSFV